MAASAPALYFRRTITLGAGGVGLAPEYVIYRVERAEGAHQDPVPALGAFPPHWRPLDSSPGVVNFDRAWRESAYLPCTVPRSQFKHFEQISEQAARVLFPDYPICAAITIGK